jgi:predicted esterase
VRNKPGRLGWTRAFAALCVAAVLSAACLPGAATPSPSARPAYCAAAVQDALQEITGTPAGPYFVHHPAAQTARVPTVVFLPGGSGLRRNAQRVWDTFLAGAKGVDAFRVAVPYWPDIEMPEDFRRTLAVVDEVLACYGGDARQVHIAGFSNGGHAAFELMLEQPERFATLLGAPGEFPAGTTPADLAVLKGKAVFNGVGERDDEFWHEGVRDAHEALTSAGVESVYVEFKGQGHGATEGFPKDLLFEFWTKHSEIASR